ncbi:MAG: hypothetical protein VX829_01605 [Pseudomonadota bacterium]|uniref:hypothetical protein n=1 Tax=Methylophaga aminisulfidivorans TaxID=230105 RepID=UPI0024E21023|nr:hypothetical protein [Methylophaga aminisulfidivorans]MEC9411354.1 hypothetical protein [Pseudomonadota bacterium]
MQTQTHENTDPLVVQASFRLPHLLTEKRSKGTSKDTSPYNLYSQSTAQHMGEEAIIPTPHKFLSMADACQKPAPLQRVLMMLSELKESGRRKPITLRLAAIAINMKYTELGIAPAWRNNVTIQADNIQSRLLDPLDLRVIDLEWLHSKRINEQYSLDTSPIYLELFNKDKFDFDLAYKLVKQETDTNTGLVALNLNEEIQKELISYKLPRLSEEFRRVVMLRSEVEKDLKLAASRNPRMGKKLLDVIPDRLDQWMSTQISRSDSKTVMYETYKKITGSSITASSYKAKLQALKNALRRANSQFVHLGCEVNG